jgi:hypothetical protein
VRGAQHRLVKENSSIPRHRGEVSSGEKIELGHKDLEKERIKTSTRKEGRRRRRDCEKNEQGIESVMTYRRGSVPIGRLHVVQTSVCLQASGEVKCDWMYSCDVQHFQFSTLVHACISQILKTSFVFHLSARESFITIIQDVQAGHIPFISTSSYLLYGYPCW